MTPIYCLVTVKGTHDVDLKLPSFHQSQPRIYELGAMVIGRRGNVKTSFCHLITPDRWEITKFEPEKNAMIMRDCKDYGVDIQYAMSVLSILTLKADAVVFYNKVTDLQLLHAEWYKSNSGKSGDVWNPGKPIQEIAQGAKEYMKTDFTPSLAQAISYQRGKKLTDHSAHSYLNAMRQLVSCGIM